MNIKKISGLCIMALMTILVLTITAISVTPTAVAQNMTGGNTTGQIGSSQAEVEALCSLSPACIT
jgi:ATP/ADP translocase